MGTTEYKETAHWINKKVFDFNFLTVAKTLDIYLACVFCCCVFRLEMKFFPYGCPHLCLLLPQFHRVANLTTLEMGTMGAQE